MTIKEAQLFCYKELNHISASPRLDTDILIAHILKIPRYKLITDTTTDLKNQEQLQLIEAISLRRLNMPIAYIIGTKEFFGLSFLVNKCTLIPRPESEILVEQTLFLIQNSKKTRLNILEIGSGSGCISIAIAKNSPKNISIISIDISKEALIVARHNKSNLLDKNKRKQLKFIHLNIDKLKREIGTFDIIISNPPYIPTSEIEQLPKNVKDFEPIKALDGGRTGLKFYNLIFNLISKITTTDAVILLELHAMLYKKIQEIFSIKYKTTIIMDLAKKPRVLKVVS